MKTLKFVVILSTLVSMMVGCSSFQMSKTEMLTDALIVTDWYQTKRISDQPVYHEHNPVLGEHPSSESVATYFVSSLILNFVVHRYLDKKYIPYYQTAIIASESGVIIDNYNIGIR